MDTQVRPKTSTERTRAYRERQKLGKTAKSAPKSSAQRSKEYRARLKASYELYIKSQMQESEKPPKPSPKDNKQRCREYRARRKALKSSNGTIQKNDQAGNISESSNTQESQGSSKPRKDNKQRCKDYRERKKLKALMSRLSEQPKQFTDQSNDFSESSSVPNGSEPVSNGNSLADAETGRMADFGGYEDDDDGMYMSLREKYFNESPNIEFEGTAHVTEI